MSNILFWGHCWGQRRGRGCCITHRAAQEKEPTQQGLQGPLWGALPQNTWVKERRCPALLGLWGLALDGEDPCLRTGEKSKMPRDSSGPEVTSAVTESSLKCQEKSEGAIRRRAGAVLGSRVPHGPSSWRTFPIPPSVRVRVCVRVRSSSWYLGCGMGCWA